MALGLLPHHILRQSYCQGLACSFSSLKNEPIKQIKLTALLICCRQYLVVSKDFWVVYSKSEWIGILTVEQLNKLQCDFVIVAGEKRFMKTTKYSLLELAMVNDNCSHEMVFKNSVEVAQKTETLGYHRFWLAEHHNMISIASSATVVLMGHIAAKTNTIRIGSGGIMLPNHSPLLVAEQLGTLGNLFPNRLDLGLGRAPGTDQMTAHAIRSDRVQSVHQFPNEIDEIQGYFENTSASKPVRAAVAEGVDVPIYILGSSTDSAHLAAKKGLPYVFASHFAPAQLHQALSIYHNEFEPSKYLDKPYTMAGVNIIVADTAAEAEHRSTSMYRMMLGVLTQQPDYMRAPIEMNDEIRQLRSHPALQQMLKYTFIGDKNGVRKQLEQFIQDTGVNELMTTSYLYHQEHRLQSLELFAEIMNEE